MAFYQVTPDVGPITVYVYFVSITAIPSIDIRDNYTKYDIQIPRPQKKHLILFEIFYPYYILSLSGFVSPTLL
jgi:hypothetical protein